MNTMFGARRLEKIHSDIRGPLFYEATEMEKQGVEVLKLNTGNPASFGFTMADSISRVLKENLNKALGYCDFRGMSGEGRIADPHFRNSGKCRL